MALDCLTNVPFDLFPNLPDWKNGPESMIFFDLHDLHDLICTFARITQKRSRFGIDLSDQFCRMDFNEFAIP